ncbi:MAG: tetratricopeptide repeat protein [Phocaeicola sp.]
MKKAITLCLALLFRGMLSAQSYNEITSQALQAVEKDSLVQAEQLFKEALRLDPANMRNALLFSNLGTVQRRMNRPIEAIESYTMALNITPYAIPVLLDRASLYLERNLLDKAYLDYSQVLDLDRLNPEALFYRAYVYAQRREYAEAQIDYKTLLTVEPNHKMAGMGLAWLLQKWMRHRDALEEYNRLLTLFPEDATILVARANLALEMNTPDLALLDLEAASKLTPEDGEIHILRGDIYLSQKKRRAAKEAYEKAMALGVPRTELQERLKAAK